MDTSLDLKYKVSLSQFVSGSLGNICENVFFITFVAGKMCLTKVFQNLCIYRDKCVR